jgi:N-acetylmuramic acid 6-phosphate etherase
MADPLTFTAPGRDREPLERLTAEEIVRRMNAEDARLASAVAARAPVIARAIDGVAERLRGGGRLIYVGAGTSGRLGVLDAAECPSTFGTDPAQVVAVIAGGPAALTGPVAEAEDRAEAGARDLLALEVGRRDVVVGVTASGRTPYVLGALEHARRRGAWVVGLCCSAETDLAEVADLLIALDVGPEVIAGSTRLKAGTATRMVLNMLSTGAMIRSGRTFDNLMVDLLPLNDKLRERARGIVAGLTGLLDHEAAALLGRCEGEVKTAVVAHLCGLPAAAARRLLDRAAGRLREALEAGLGEEARGVKQGRDPSGLVLGVDAGGSKTAAVLALPDGGVVGRGTAGPGNLSAGVERAVAAIRAAIDAARAGAGAVPGPFAAAFVACAGAGCEETRRALEDWAKRHDLARRVEVAPDFVPVLDRASAEGQGIAVICGAGAIAFGRNSRGETARAGGWGWLAGEEGGGGFAIGSAALRAVVRAADGRGPATRLTERLLAHFRARDVRAIVTAAHRADGDSVTRLAQLAKVTSQAADEGDEVARGILRSCATHLASLTESVAERLGVRGSPFPLALAGGVVLHCKPVRRMYEERLGELGSSPGKIIPVERPAESAARLARDLAGRG